MLYEISRLDEFILSVLCIIAITMSTYGADHTGLVNCGHVRRLFAVDSTMFDLGKTLTECWHRGLRYGGAEEGLDGLYLPCADAFASNLSRLTSSLLEDYIACKNTQAFDSELENFMEERYAEIVQVHVFGNNSLTINQTTSVSCRNASQQVSFLCRDYGITENQWQKGFLRYHYNDRWAVEEKLVELSLPCDRVFAAHLEEDVYDNPIEAFFKCQYIMSLEPEMRDAFERKNAKEIMEYRAQESPNSPNPDPRAYVSCGHLEPVRIGSVWMSTSWSAYKKCHTSGASYEKLRGFPENEQRDFRRLYLPCKNVFDEQLHSFSSDLLEDYRACERAGEVGIETRKIIRQKFHELFHLFESKKQQFKSADLMEHLVSCSSFESELSEFCRKAGSTLFQQEQGLGSLPRILDGLWINSEPLDKLYLRCEDLFNHLELLRNVHVERFVQCKWSEINEDAKTFIDQKIAEAYNISSSERNDTMFRGDIDVQITSVILST